MTAIVAVCNTAITFAVPLLLPGLLTSDGEVVRLISPKSPLGRAMGGLEAEDGFEVTSPTGVVEYELLEVL